MERRMVGLLIVLLLAANAAATDWTVGVQTNGSSDALKVYAGLQFDDLEVGGFGKYYSEDQDPPWGAGVYGKMYIDPNGMIPFKNWFPVLGDLLNLPDTLNVSPYVKGEIEVVPMENHARFVASIGPGAQIAFVSIDYLYQIVEGGESDRPVLSSKPVFWFGLAKPWRF